MDKEKTPSPRRQGALVAFEWAAGTWGFILGCTSLARIIQSGPESVIKIVEHALQYSSFDLPALVLHKTTQLGVPIELTTGIILIGSTTMVVDGFRRNEVMEKFFRRKDVVNS